MEKVIGVMCGKNSEPRMKLVLDSCRGQMEKLIFVDCSDDETIKEEIRRIEKESNGFMTVLWNSVDIGSPGSFNQGAKKAIELGAEWIPTLTDDAILPDNMVSMMLAAYHALPPEQQKIVSIITPNLMSMRGLAFPDGEPVVNDEGGTTEGQLVKASVLPIIGFWNEALFMDGMDGEFCFRMRMHGYKTLLVPRAIVQARYGHPTMRRFLWKMAMVPDYRPYRYYYISRNVMYLFVRNFNPYTVHMLHKKDFVWAIIIPRYFIKMLFFDTDRSTKIRACFHGWWDGIRGKLGPMPPYFS